MALVLRPPAERASLPDQLAELGRARKRFALAAGAFTFLATVIGSAALAGFLDAAIHLGALPRALALVVLLTAAGVVFFRGVVRPLRYRTDPLSLALELENKFPGLNDALASAIDFLGDPEDDEDDRPRKTGISNRLTASAVRVAERKANRLPLDSIVPAARCWRALFALVAVLGVALPLVLWNMNRAALAAVRLADPFGAHPWPTKTQIQILAPEQFPARVSKGEPFELKFAVRGVMVGPAVVRVRVVGGGDTEEQFPLAPDNDPKHPGAAVVTVKFDPARVTSSFAVRVTSNDADTDWKDVTMVPPPRLVPLDGRPSPQFHATPPEYTRLPAGQLPDGAAVIEVPVGTVLRFRAATDVKLSAAKLLYDPDAQGNRAARDAVLNAAPVAFLGHTNPFATVGAQGLAATFASDIPVTISSDGTRISADFVPLLSGSYALKLTDDTGLTGTRLIEIRLTADPVPAVALVRPLAGYGPPMLTPSASVDVRTTADDKLYGVRRSFLEYRVNRDGRVRTIPLAEAMNVALPPLSALVGAPIVADRPQLNTVEVARVIPVSSFLRADGTPVREGDLLVIRAAADDWDDVARLKGPGRSAAEVEIRIESPERIEAWLQKELAGFRPELLDVRKQQRKAKELVLGVFPQDGGAVAPTDRDKLAIAEQAQRQVRGKIADPRDGLRAKADLLRATVLANGLPKSNTTDRVEIVATLLDHTADRDLGTVEQTLAATRQLSGQPARPGLEQQLKDHLRKTAGYQKNVEDTTTTLLDLLSQWGDAGDIRGEAHTLREKVLRLIAANEGLKRQILTGKVKPNSSEQWALDRVADGIGDAANAAGSLIARLARFANPNTELVRALNARSERASAPVLRAVLGSWATAVGETTIDLRPGAARRATEVAALRRALKAAGGQGLADDLRDKAKRAVEQNRLNDGEGATEQLRQALERIEALIAALAERDSDAVPELTKALKGAADQLDALAGAQDELRKKVEAAMKEQDPEKRQQLLKELAKEQDRLIERGRELLQKLTREKADNAAKLTRDAIERMESAREDLENGKAPNRLQNDAVKRLDKARDDLDETTARLERQLSDEKRRKLADQVKALLERQKAAVAEAKRIHGEVAKAKGWNEGLKDSYSGIDKVTEREIAIEVRKLAEGDFAALPVLTRLLTDCAEAIGLGDEDTDTPRAAREHIRTRCNSIDFNVYDAEYEAAHARKVLRKMELAQKRLEQLAEVLKPDDPKKQPDKTVGNPPPKPPNNPPQPNPNGGGGGQDVVPPLAQLKALRELQAELNKNTAQFAKDHPDPDKLTDEEKAELEELEQAQREITELFEKMAKLFEKEKKDAPPGEEKKIEPEKEEGKKPEAKKEEDKKDDKKKE